MGPSRSVQGAPAADPLRWFARFGTLENEMYNAVLKGHRESLQDRRKIAWKDTELKKARKQNDRLRNDLDRYQTQIFRSINPFQVSDASISQELMSIQDSLSNWVSTLPDSQGFVQNWPELHRFLMDNGFITFNFTFSPDAIGLMEAEILMSSAFRILWAILFKPSLPGASPDICSFLDVIQTNMSQLEPKKEKAAISSWRSDMYRALSRSPQYASMAESECQSACYMITYALTLSGHINEDCRESRANQLMEQVLRPAAALAMQIRCSLEEYCWDWPPHFPAEVQKDHLITWQCIDLRTHSEIRTRAFQHESGSSVIGDFMLIVFPALYRLVDGEQGRLLIGKGQLLVNTGAPVTRIKDEPTSPNIRQDHLLTQVKEEPKSSNITQDHPLRVQVNEEPKSPQLA